GTIIPGTSTGTMTYPVSQTFASTTMQFEVNGTTPDTEHDQIIVTGTATISGTLNASINYTPSNGDRIVLLSATSVSGTFSSINPALPYDWDVDYSVPGEVALVYAYTIGRWDGEVGDGLWTSADNWEGGVLPTSSVDVIIDNGDAVTLPSGTVTVHTLSISNDSDLSISAGATLNVNNSGFSNTVYVSGYSSAVIVGGTVNITGGNAGVYLENADWTTQTGGQVNISSYSGNGFSHSSGGYLTNAGTMTITGGVRGVSMSGGIVNNRAGAVLTVENTSNGGISVPGSGDLSNNGTIQVNNCGGTSVSATWISNNGTISISNAGSIGIYGVADLFNAGTITITGATGVGVYGDDTNFNNSGTIAISGTSGYAFNFDDNGYPYTFSNTGTLQGIGTFDMAGNDLSGTIIPGTSTGTMTYPVSQTFASTTMQFEVNGTTPDTEHDQIIVTGTATISGALDATISYPPATNDRIVIISATAISGVFSSDNLPVDWSIDYSQPGEVALVYSGLTVPVELFDFSAEIEETQVRLIWQTATELNNSHFEVEWSVNGIAFEKIGAVQGHGTTAEVQRYELLHEQPANGVNYYRLRQVDFDGQFEYSDIRSVEFESLGRQIKIFPNPASTLSHIQIPGNFEFAIIRAFDASGRMLFSKELKGGQALQDIDVSDWHSGLYVLQIDVDGKTFIQKLEVSND
ncbi:MAG: T9SS type A sorting domain-containing protein, partial [Phaeodactylibacter sp.]|nr:T9SS type A sorting domain-containing protein [Phaeodactylibacter sp.]